MTAPSLPPRTSAGRRRFLHAASTLALAGGISPLARASGYPERPVRIIVAWSPGGTVDFVARTMAEQYSKLLDASFVVENRPGAAGVIGFSALAQAPANGYTYVIDNTALFLTMPATSAHLPFNPDRDFIAVAPVFETPVALVVSASLNVATLKDFIAMVKANPGKFNYGSGGAASTTHLQAAIFNEVAGIDIAHVPYKGGGDAMRAVMAGEVQMLITGAPTILSQASSGRIKVLAVSGHKRLAGLPLVPTFAEAGLPGYTVTNRYSLIAPSKLPKDIAAKMVDATQRVLADPVAQRLMASRGGVPVEAGSVDSGKPDLNAEQWKNILGKMRTGGAS
ncbi:Bug family tripartite tricarboxylate transporter substrate binding protein [Candidimonas nitroreducens]|nr:tripartite tricarboxylate transporter substrate binding protein [Candidimonas nitroreducens]